MIIGNKNRMQENVKMHEKINKIKCKVGASIKQGGCSNQKSKLSLRDRLGRTSPTGMGMGRLIDQTALIKEARVHAKEYTQA